MKPFTFVSSSNSFQSPWSHFLSKLYKLVSLLWELASRNSSNTSCCFSRHDWLTTVKYRHVYHISCEMSKQKKGHQNKRRNLIYDTTMAFLTDFHFPGCCSATELYFVHIIIKAWLMTYSLVLKQQKCLRMWETLLAHGINLLPLIWLWRYWNFSTIPSADCGITMLHMDKQGITSHVFPMALLILHLIQNSLYFLNYFILYLFSISLLSAYFFIFHKFESIFMEWIDFYSLSSNIYHTDVNPFLWLMGTQKKVHL